MADLASIVRLRAKQAGSLRALSRATKIGVGYLSRLQNGLKANPSDAFLKRLGAERRITYKLTTRKPRNG